jgi:hypothetical protein
VAQVCNPSYSEAWDQFEASLGKKFMRPPQLNQAVYRGMHLSSSSMASTNRRIAVQAGQGINQHKLGKLAIYMQKTENKPLSLMLYENQLQMDQRP